jgi:diguanylate cyclase (GGDEF)-like protein
MRILIATGDPDQNAILSEGFARLGFGEARECWSAGELAAAAETGAADAAVLSPKLPGAEEPAELLARLRAAGVRAVLLVGKRGDPTAEALAERLAASGFRGVVWDGVRSEEIAERLARPASYAEAGVEPDEEEAAKLFVGREVEKERKGGLLGFWRRRKDGSAGGKVSVSGAAEAGAKEAGLLRARREREEPPPAGPGPSRGAPELSANGIAPGAGAEERTEGFLRLDSEGMPRETEPGVDALTGLPGRGALARLSRGFRGSVLFCDLDGLKRVNDSFGHAAGDEVLRAFAAALKSWMRGSDAALRWGGDEFVVLLGGCGERDARKAAARLKEAWAGNLMAKRYGTGVSIGAAEVRGSVEEAVDAADRDMYRNKRRARPAQGGGLLVFGWEELERLESAVERAARPVLVADADGAALARLGLAAVWRADWSLGAAAEPAEVRPGLFVLGPSGELDGAARTEDAFMAALRRHAGRCASAVVYVGRSDSLAERVLAECAG